MSIFYMKKKYISKKTQKNTNKKISHKKKLKAR